MCSMGYIRGQLATTIVISNYLYFGKFPPFKSKCEYVNPSQKVNLSETISAKLNPTNN